MKCKYLTRDYNQRLSRTMCRYKGDIVFLECDNTEILGKRTYNGDYFLIDDVENIDVSSIPLGYVNTNNGALYVMRLPVRSYKQGVCDNNIRGVTVGGEARAVSVNTQQFFDMARGEYPSLSSVLSSKSTTTKAISRDVAISTNDLGVRSVYYKNQLVGWMAPDSNEVIIPNTERVELVNRYLKASSLKVKE